MPIHCQTDDYEPDRAPAYTMASSGYEYSDGSAGFFRYIGSDSAATMVESLSGVKGSSAKKYFGQAWDNVETTQSPFNVENIAKSLDIIEKCNELRKNEGLDELKVDPTLMAISQISAAWGQRYEIPGSGVNHNNVHVVASDNDLAENFAFGSSSVDMAFQQLYDSEKKIYEESGDSGFRAAFEMYMNKEERTYHPDYGYVKTYHNFNNSVLLASKEDHDTYEKVGHYLNIINPQYKVTGASFSKGISGGYRTIYEQSFDYSASGKTYTVSELRSKLSAYLDLIEDTKPEPDPSTEFDITLVQPSVGRIYRDHSSAKAGTEVTIIYRLSDEYQLKSITVSWGNSTKTVVAQKKNSATFTMPVGDVTVTANIEKIQLKTQTITCQSSFYKDFNDPAFNLNASTSGDGKLTYSSSNTGVATVSSSGLVTLKGAGNATITITATETGEYASATKQVTVIVSGGRYVNLPTNLQHGTLTVSPQGPIGKGETVTITSHSDAGYKLGTISAVDAFDREIPVYGTGSTRTFTMTDADVTLSATFIESDVQMRGVGFYRDKPEHGTVYVVDGESHAVGSKVTLVAMPDEGYKLDSISVMNCITGEYPALSGSGDTYTFTMPDADVAIFATFTPAEGEEHKITTYPVTRFLAAGSSIELSTDSAVAGEQVTVTVTPSSRRWVTHFTARDKDDSVIKASGDMLSEGKTQFTFTMPDSDVVVEIGFKTKFIPTISNGTAEVSNTNPSSGETVIVTVTPEPGYTAELIKIMGDELNYDTYPLRENYFEVPVAAWDYGSVDVWMEYVGSRNVSLEASDHGTVSTSSANPLVASTVTVTAEPERGYTLQSLTVTDSNGNDVTVSGVGNTRTFVMPNADVTVRAEFVEGEAPVFPDVPDDAWYHDAVEWVASNGVMTGQGDGTFAPDGTLQRCEMAQLLWNMAGRPAADAGAMAGFPDYAGGQWYSDAMAWAFAEGAITGYEDGRLGTSDPVTREQFVTIVWRLEGRPAGEGDLSAFPDEGDVSEFSREALAWAVSEGIVTGDGGRLSPAKALSRAEAATMLMRWRG